MKVYSYKELREKSVDDLLDLLSSFNKEKKETYLLIKSDPCNEKFYIENHLYFQELNIRKVKNELILRTELKH